MGSSPDPSASPARPSLLDAAPDDELSQALRRARREAAERVAEAKPARAPRDAERERLEALRAAIAPILSKIPADVDLFDLALAPAVPRQDETARARLFLDLIGYVECEGETGFRLVRATRRGRVVAGTASDLESARRMAVDYIARRLVERERALDRDTSAENAAPDLPARPAAPKTSPAPEVPAESAAPHAPAAPIPLRPAPVGREPSEAFRRRAFEAMAANRAGDAANWLSAAPRPPRAPAPRLGDFEDEPALATAPAPAPTSSPAPATPAPAEAASKEEERPAPVPTLRQRLAARWRARAKAGARQRGRLARGLDFTVQFLGSAALTLAVALIAWWAWREIGLPPKP